MFAVNGNRPGPNPNGQTYGEILRAANAEERALAAALPKRADRAYLQSDFSGDTDPIPHTDFLVRSVVPSAGLESGDNHADCGPDAGEYPVDLREPLE